MNRLMRLHLFALVFCAAVFVVGVAAETMTIDELRTAGTDQHPAVRKSLSEWHAVRGDWIQAGLGENPSVGWVADTIGAGRSAGRSAGQQGVGMEKTFTPSSTLSARQRVASRQSESARCAYETARQQASADLAILGYRVYFSQQRLASYRRLIETIAKSLAANEKRLAALEISRAELLQEKIELNRRVTEEHAESRRLAGLQQQLGLLLGREMRGVVLVPPADIASETMPRDTGVSETTLLAASPEMQRRYAEIEVARAELARFRSENSRPLTASAQMLYDTETREGLVSLGVAIPLRTTNRQQGNILASQHRLSASHHEADRVRLAIQSRLAAKVADYDAAYAKWDFYHKTILADARQMLQLMTQTYAHGECTSLDVLIAQRTLVQVELEYLDAMERLATVRVELEHSLLTGALGE